MARINKTYYQVDSEFDKKIVLISDLHYYSKFDIDKFNKILNEIVEIKPDFICIPGDFIDEAVVHDMDLFIKYLKLLSKVCKVIISLGNHDIAIRSSNTYYYNNEFFNRISKINNVSLLNNKTIDIDDICFVGINLGSDYYNYDNCKKEFRKKLNSINDIDPKKYNILLCHCPMTVTKDDIVDKLTDKIDLVLCGHMHGGLTPQIFQKILKNKVLISPNKHHFFVKDSYGYLKKESVHYIITSGVTKLSHSSHISWLDKFFSPEIVIIDLIKRS